MVYELLYLLNIYALNLCLLRNGFRLLGSLDLTTQIHTCI